MGRNQHSHIVGYNSDDDGNGSDGHGPIDPVILASVDARRVYPVTDGFVHMKSYDLRLLTALFIHLIIIRDEDTTNMREIRRFKE